MDQIHEALSDLEILGVIVSETSDTITIDRFKLNKIGYTLLFNGYEPEFATNDDLNYMYDSILYCSDVIPKSSLKSFVMLKIKNIRISP